MKRVFSQTFGVVGACIVKDNNQILLVKENRPNHPDHGKWNQPAGWLDVGEHPLDAVKREVKEETGYVFTPTALLGVYSLVKKKRQKIANKTVQTQHAIKLIFIGKISGPQRNLHSDVSQAQWFSFTEVKQMNDETLRDADIKTLIDDYQAGKHYPLDSLRHSVMD